MSSPCCLNLFAHGRAFARRRKLEIETKRDLAIQKLEATAIEELNKLEEDYQNEILTKRKAEPTGRSICQLCYDLDEAACTFFLLQNPSCLHVTPVFIPCGHRICFTCLSSMGYNLETPVVFTCPWDRKAIAKVVTLDSPSGIP